MVKKIKEEIQENKYPQGIPAKIKRVKEEQEKNLSNLKELDIVNKKYKDFFLRTAIHFRTV